jgi:gas vesicle protein
MMKDIFYFLLGALVGAVFALLFAPQSGDELRANLQSSAEKEWSALQEQLQVEMQKINQRLDQIQSGPKQTDSEPEQVADAGAEESQAAEAAA